MGEVGKIGRADGSIGPSRRLLAPAIAQQSEGEGKVGGDGDFGIRGGRGDQLHGAAERFEG
jgi:hypothetical protein